jgi:hypothetical protein
MYNARYGWMYSNPACMAAQIIASTSATSPDQYACGHDRHHPTDLSRAWPTESAMIIRWCMGVQQN